MNAAQGQSLTHGTDAENAISTRLDELETFTLAPKEHWSEVTGSPYNWKAGAISA